MKLSLFLFLTSQLGLADSQQCQKFNRSLSQVCGYDKTVKFNDKNTFDTNARSVDIIRRMMKNCSKYSDLMTCSFYLPRCKEDLHGPYLPCRGVCDAFVKDCRNEITENNLEWMASYCRKFLPRRDDPEATKGYLGRCFEPANYKPTPGMRRYAVV